MVAHLSIYHPRPQGIGLDNDEYLHFHVGRVWLFVHEFSIFNSFFFCKMMDEFFDVELEDQESQEGWGVELAFDPVGNIHPSMQSNVEVQYQESAEVTIQLH